MKDSNGNYDINAHYNLGVMYLRGIDGKKDEEKALKHLNIALAQRHPKAFYHVAKMYQKGVGVPEKNPEIVSYQLIRFDSEESVLLPGGF